LKAVESGHVHIHRHPVRLEFTRRQQGLITGAAFAKNEAGQRRRLPDYFARGRVVIHDHQSHIKYSCFEQIKKYCSHSAGKNKAAVFLGFGFVSAQLQGSLNLRLRQSLAKTPKILAPNGYSIF
jgi:hypothetical protein